MRLLLVLAFVMTGGSAFAQSYVRCAVGKTCTPYVVKPGDTLSEITRDVTGGRNWSAVFETNRNRFRRKPGQRVRSPHLIYPGQVIVLTR